MSRYKLKLNIAVSSVMMFSLIGSYGDPEYTPIRYKLIMDRNPFGTKVEEPDESLIDHTPPQAEVTVDKELRLCMLMKGDNGSVRVGFQRKTKDKKGFVLSVGETIDGLKLLSVDLNNDQATILQHGQQVVFKMEKSKSSAQTANRRTAVPRSRNNTTVQQNKRSVKTRSEEYEARRKALLERIRKRREASR